MGCPSRGIEGSNVEGNVGCAGPAQVVSVVKNVGKWHTDSSLSQTLVQPCLFVLPLSWVKKHVLSLPRKRPHTQQQIEYS